MNPKITKMMKLLLPIIALLLGTPLLQAQCHQRNNYYRPSCNSSTIYLTGYAKCGCPRYQKRLLIGYDCRNYPIYRYCSVPFRCKCSKKCNTQPYYQRKCSKYYQKHRYNRSKYYRKHKSHRHHNRNYKRSKVVVHY